MGELNREEVEARIETAEMHMAATIARMEERHEAFVRRLDERDVEWRRVFTRLETDMRDFRDDVHREERTTRRTTVVTGISAVLAIFFGVAAVNAALLTHFQGGIEAGTRMAAEHEAIRKDLRDLTVAVSQLAVVVDKLNHRMDQVGQRMDGVERRLPEPPRK